MVKDCGDQCLFDFECRCRFFSKVFPFSVCKGQLIGDWDENRQGAAKCSVCLFFKKFLSVRQFWDPTHPLSCKQVCPPPGTKGGDTLTCGFSGWDPNSDDWRESLSAQAVKNPQ
jgi:hypothetical protein